MNINFTFNALNVPPEFEKKVRLFNQRFIANGTEEEGVFRVRNNKIRRIGGRDDYGYSIVDD